MHVFAKGPGVVDPASRACYDGRPALAARGASKTCLAARGFKDGRERGLSIRAFRFCAPVTRSCQLGACGAAGSQLSMSCAAPEASPREQSGTKHVVAGTSHGDDPTSLRDSAIRLAEAGQVRAAIPLFQAVVALDPSKPLGHSDEGVSWMRLKEYEQARLAPTPLSHPCPRLAPAAMPRTRSHATDCRRGSRRAVVGRVQARARPRAGARPLAAEPEGPHRVPLAHRRRPAHHAPHLVESKVAQPSANAPSSTPRRRQSRLWAASTLGQPRPTSRSVASRSVAQPSASWRSGGCSQHQIVLQAGPSSSQPRPVSRLGCITTGRPHRPCSPHRRDDDPKPPPRPPRPREHVVSPIPRLAALTIPNANPEPKPEPKPNPNPNPDQVSPIPRRASVATDTEWCVMHDAP